MAQRAGWEARVRLGEVGASLTSLPWFAVRRFELDDETPQIDVGNTEGKPGNPSAPNQAARGFAANISDQKRCRVTLEQATYNDTDSPFAAPYGQGADGIKTGDYLQCAVYPNGSTNPHTVSSFKVTRVRYSGQVGDRQPVTIEGVSDGEYTFA